MTEQSLFRLQQIFKGDTLDLLKYGYGPKTAGNVDKVVPFGTVLTLPATGSEMNAGAVISYGTGKVCYNQRTYLS